MLLPRCPSLLPFTKSPLLEDTGSYKEGAGKGAVAQLPSDKDTGPLDSHSTLLPTTRYIKAHSPAPIGEGVLNSRQACSKGFGKRRGWRAGEIAHRQARGRAGVKEKTLSV